VGIPAELLRRRPDVRRAERLAAAQSAVIGIAESDFYPRIAITGFIGVESQDLVDLFDGRSLAGSIGPGFGWNILNYGRIRNNVLANEARFYQLVLDYQNTVLQAHQEVEDGIVSFLKERETARALQESAASAQRAVDIGMVKWREGNIDFQPVVYMQQILTSRQDQLATSRGAVCENVVSVYKALGGGWQTRMGGTGTLQNLAATPSENPVEDAATPPPVDRTPPVAPAPPAPPPAP
jgi:outer membrane protein TolC